LKEYALIKAGKIRNRLHGGKEGMPVLIERP